MTRRQPQATSPSRALLQLLKPTASAWCLTLLLSPGASAADSPLLAPSSPPALQTRTGIGANDGLQQILPAEQAFPMQALVESDGSIHIHWQYGSGYYLYRKSLAARDGGGRVLTLELPESTTLTDEFFGEVEVYHDSLSLRIAPDSHGVVPGGRLEIEVDYQGCLADRYCYPPQVKQLGFTLPE